MTQLDEQLTRERDEARRLVVAWRKALADFAKDENAFMDHFHDVLNQCDRLEWVKRYSTREAAK